MAAVRLILAVLAGLLVGSIINGGIISLSSFIIPPPEGADVTSMEGLREAMYLFEPKHFIMPFLAHALGTLAGAFLAVKITKTRKMTLALILGIFFLFGGIANAFMLPAPTWFIAVDLALAYIPMAWLGWKLAD